MSGAEGRANTGDAHVFGENPAPGPQPHEGTRRWHEAKTRLEAEQAQELRQLLTEYNALKDEIARKYTEKFRAAAQEAGFR
jgi:hypothetical protein